MMAALLLMFILIMLLAVERANYNSNQLLQKEEQIQKLLGVKPQIVSELKDELSEFEVSIDENTGDIEFKSDILFDTDKCILRDEGVLFLENFIPRYFGVILSDKYLPYIAEIIVEGHTDNDGGYEHNLKLSQDRAMSVANYIVGEESSLVMPQYRDMVRKMMTVTGKSFTNLKYVFGTNDVDKEKSRRVEIKFRLKDDETIREFESILNNAH